MNSEILPFVSSLAIGLMIGFERERSHKDVPELAAGSRTFALLALSGTLAAYFDNWIIAVGAIVIGGIMLVGYHYTSMENPGATTEVAAVVTYFIGAMMWTEPGLATGIAVIVMALLLSKDKLHSFAKEIITDIEFEDAIKFLAMAFVILPMLPDHDVGPYGVLNARRIWQLVVVLTALSWVGYIAVRALGAKRGLLISGLAGGFISASATTASMASISKSSGEMRAPVAGAYLASVATFVQLAGIIAIADRQLFIKLWPALAVGVVAMVAMAAIRLARHEDKSDGKSSNESATTSTKSEIERPFALKSVVVLAGVLTFALLIGRWVADVVGAQATALATGAAGIADAHAGALSAATLHQQGQIGMSAALIAVAAAMTTNTIVKCVVSFAGGGRAFGFRFCLGAIPAFGAFLATVIFIAQA